MKQALNVHLRPVRSVQVAVVSGYLISSTFEGTGHLSLSSLRTAYLAGRDHAQSAHS